MKRSRSIYTVTTISFDEKWGSKRSRCWGWFATKRKALTVAKKHAEFFSENGYYTHIVIERCGEGVISYDHKPTWLELIISGQQEKKWVSGEGVTSVTLEDTYTAIEVKAPEQAKQIVGWGIG